MDRHLKKYKIISRIFDPIILTSISIIIVFNIYNLKFVHSVVVFLTLFLFPVVFFVYSIITKKTDYDLTEKSTRIPLYFVTLFAAILNLILLKQWGYMELAEIIAMFVILIMMLLAITYFWKISLHAIANTLFFGLMGIIYSNALLLLVPPVIALVGYSRIKLEKHTLGQIIAGFVLGSLFLGLIYLRSGS